MPSAARPAALVLGLLAVACASTPPPAPARPASARTPEGCGRDYPKDAPLLTLAPTQPPSTDQRKTQPFRIANEIKVHGALVAQAEWTDFNDGWSMLALRVTSANATSIALHLTGMQLPARTQIWLCSADGRFKQGPYREAPGGELWTPVVLGQEARLQIDVPTSDKSAFRGELAEAFGGFR